MAAEIYLNVAVSGLLTGLVYGLMALGLSVIFGVVRVVNFAHGEMMTIAMYLAIVLFGSLGLDPLAMVVPIAGVMFQRTIRVAPASVRARDYVRLGIECELALRLGTAVPASGTVDRATVAASVARVAAAFELIEDLGADYATLDWRSMAADNGWHGGLVLGPDVAVDKVEGLDAGLDGRLEIDGHPSLMGSTRDVLGHPYDAVAWLANHLAGRGERLLAGQWISTGSIVPIRHAVPGQRFRFSIASLPAVEITVT